MKFLILASLVFVSIWALPIDIPLPDLKDLTDAKLEGLFGEFGKNFKKNYKDSTKKSKALKAFKENMKNIAKLNEKFKNKKVTFGLNKYSDLSDDEFAQQMLMRSPFKLNFLGNRLGLHNLTTNFQAPEAYDWSGDSNIVAPIKDQGTCGCCWAFTVAGLVTAANGLKNQNFIEPSEQQICDCGLQDPNRIGCEGGDLGTALGYIKDKGVSSIDGYITYNEERSKQAGMCEDSGKSNDLTISDFKQIYPSNAEAIRDALVQNGPIGIGFKVGLSFRHYKSGVYEEIDCNTPATQKGWHAMVVTGYGEENGTPYWRIKNSWDTSFGQNGYINFARGTDLCELETAMVFYAIGA